VSVQVLESADFLADIKEPKKAKGPVKREFILSEEMKDLGNQIIKEERLDVHPAKIEYVLVYPNISKTTAGKCIKTGKELKFFSNLDYVIEAFKNQKLWDQVDLAVIRIIKKRTREGKDVDGVNFKPYSEGYKRKRQLNALPTHIVNLQFDDIKGMLQNVTHEVDNDFEASKVFIGDAEKELIASYHNEKGAGKGHVIRKFWGVSESEEEKIQDIAAVEVAKIIKSLPK